MQEQELMITHNSVYPETKNNEYDGRFYKKNKPYISLNPEPVGFPKRKLSFLEERDQKS